MGKEGPKDRLEMVSREPTWAKKAKRSRECFQRANLGKEGPKDRLEIPSQLGQRRSQG